MSPLLESEYLELRFAGAVDAIERRERALLRLLRLLRLLLQAEDERARVRGGERGERRHAVACGGESREVE